MGHSEPNNAIFEVQLECLQMIILAGLLTIDIFSEEEGQGGSQDLT